MNEAEEYLNELDIEYPLQNLRKSHEFYGRLVAEEKIHSAIDILLENGELTAIGALKEKKWCGK